MKILLIALLCLCGISSVNAQCWEKDLTTKTHQLKQVSCDTVKYNKTVVYPDWYASIGLTTDQIKKSVVDGISFTDTVEAYYDAYRFRGLFVYFKSKSEVLLIAGQKERPEPVAVEFGKETFSWGINICVWLFASAVFFLHRAAFKHGAYKPLFVFNVLLILSMVIALWKINNIAVDITRGIVAVGLAACSGVFVHKVLKSLNSWFWSDRFWGVVAGFFAMIVTVLTAHCSMSKPFLESLTSIWPIVTIPIVGLLVTSFLWIRSKKKGMPVPDSGIGMTN